MTSKVGRLIRIFSRPNGHIYDLPISDSAKVSSIKGLRNISLWAVSSNTPNRQSYTQFLHNLRFSTRSNGVSISSVDYSDIKELAKHPEKLLIDVREPQELAETGTIPTSINIPLDSVTQVLAEDDSPQNFQSRYGRQKPSVGDEIIFTCKLGKRAHRAAELAKGMGFNNVKYYAGSWDDWTQHENK